VPPSFLVEEMLHRNALFCVLHAEAMPRVTIGEPVMTPLGNGATAIDVVFENERAIPTRTARAAGVKIGAPDRFHLEGDDLEVLAGGFRSDRFRPEVIDLQEHEPARLVREAGLGSREKLRVRWIVQGSGRALIVHEGEKTSRTQRIVIVE